MKTIVFIILSIFLIPGIYAQPNTGAVASAEVDKDQKSLKFYQVLRTIINAAPGGFEDIKGAKLKSIVGSKYEATVVPPDALAVYIEKNIWPTYHATLYKSSKYRAAKKVYEDYEKQMQCDLITGWHIYENQSYRDNLLVYSVGTEANKLRGTEVTLTMRKNYEGIYIVELDVIKKK